MNRILITFLFLSGGILVYGQSYPTYTPPALSNDQNYILTRTYQTPKTTTPLSVDHEDVVIENVTYLDGLGRPIQKIGIDAGGDGDDILNLIVYDQYGRESKQWLPFNASGDKGSFRTGNIQMSIAYSYAYLFYEEFGGSGNLANPYSVILFDESPLNRIIKQAAPGLDWKMGAGKEIELNYQTNSSYEVRQYEIDLVFTSGVYSPTLNLSSNNNGYYTAGELFKTIIKDENHISGNRHTTEEFKDKKGRVVLKRTYGDSDINGDGDSIDPGEISTKHDTYYVYDDFGNLTYVLPPKTNSSLAAPSSNELTELCYTYKYDKFNRLAEKRIPGKGWEYIVYNKMNQPVLIQDQNLKAQNKWLFTKYDALGKITYTGYISNGNGRSALQGTLDGATSIYEEKQSSSRSLGGTSLY